jgi:hypothetical protein
MGGRADVLVDVRNPPVSADEERPPGRERLIGVYDTIGSRDRSRGIAQKRVINAERLRERQIGLGRIDANREIRDVEGPNLVPTLTE